MSIHVLQAPRFTLTPTQRVTQRTAQRTTQRTARRATRAASARPATVAPAASRAAAGTTPRATTRRPMSAGRTAPSAAASLHLTRRGRLLFIGLPVLFLTAVLLTAVALVTTAPAAADQSVRGVPSTPAVQITVQPGQSLWDVAAANAEGRDTRDVLAGIVELNGLPDDHIDAGRKLYVPLGS